MRKHWDKPVKIWEAVRRELSWCGALLHLGGRDLSAVWSERIHVFDASYLGRGVVTKHCDRAIVQSAGQHSDRWRFSKSEELGISLRDRIKMDQSGKFPDVPIHLWGGPCKVAVRKSWES